MMTSDNSPDEAFVWVWLPGHTEPVVASRIVRDGAREGNRLIFNYGRSYLQRDQPKATSRELFKRLVFNILCGNTDDHARNHAAFWDGESLTLTPAYDICLQARAGGEAGQAMLITCQTNRSQLAVCLQAAPHFLLNESEATEIIEHQLTSLHAEWVHIAEEAELTGVESGVLWGRQLLNAFAFEGAPQKIKSFRSLPG